MYDYVIAYYSYWVNFAVAAGTIIAAGVTAWMAWRTADMAKATRALAASARDELKFMKDEADRMTTSDLRTYLSQAPLNSGPNGCSVDARVVVRLENLGPSNAHEITCFAFLTSERPTSRPVPSSPARPPVYWATKPATSRMKQPKMKQATEPITGSRRQRMKRSLLIAALVAALSTPRPCAARTSASQPPPPALSLSPVSAVPTTPRSSWPPPSPPGALFSNPPSAIP